MWQAVPGYEGIYEAQPNVGVRSLDRIIIDSRGQYRRLRGRFLGGNPHERIILSRNGVQEITTVQAVIDRTFGVQIPA
jgi:hypothetical protein